MNAQDKLGLGQAELVVAGIEEDAALVDHRAHGAIEHERPFPDLLEQVPRFFHGADFTIRPAPRPAQKVYIKM